MDKARREKQLMIALPLLFVVMAVVWLPQLMGARRDTAKGKNATGESFADVENLVSQVASFSVNELMSSPPEGAWPRDPFVEINVPSSEIVAPVAVVAAVPDGRDPLQSEDPFAHLVLQGIFWNRQKAAALVNDTVVSVGSRLDQVTVTDIQPDRVVFSDGQVEQVFFSGR